MLWPVAASFQSLSRPHVAFVPFFSTDTFHWLWGPPALITQADLIMKALITSAQALFLQIRPHSQVLDGSIFWGPPLNTLLGARVATGKSAKGPRCHSGSSDSGLARTGDAECGGLQRSQEAELQGPKE